MDQFIGSNEGKQILVTGIIPHLMLSEVRNLWSAYPTLLKVIKEGIKTYNVVCLPELARQWIYNDIEAIEIIRQFIPNFKIMGSVCTREDVYMENIASLSKPKLINAKSGDIITFNLQIDDENDNLVSVNYIYLHAKNCSDNKYKLYDLNLTPRQYKNLKKYVFSDSELIIGLPWYYENFGVNYWCNIANICVGLCYEDIEFVKNTFCKKDNVSSMKVTKGFNLCIDHKVWSNNEVRSNFYELYSRHEYYKLMEYDSFKEKHMIDFIRNISPVLFDTYHRQNDMSNNLYLLPRYLTFR